MPKPPQQSLCALALSSLVLAGCGGAFDGNGALLLANGEDVNADEIERNARPHIDTSAVGLIYDGSEITPVTFDRYADPEAFYLLIQVQEGWDIDLNPQVTQPFEIRKFIDFDQPIEQIPLPRNIDPLTNVVAEGCQFVDTTEVGMLAIQCADEFAVLAPDSTEWTYFSDPGLGTPTYVGPESLYFDEEASGTEYPLVYIGGQQKSLGDLPGAFGTVEKHWIGPWDGERVRVIYKPDPLQLCASVWNLADASVRADGCLTFDAPGAEPLSTGHIGGDVDETVFFAGGETNTKERGDDVWATAKEGSVEIVGRTSDRGNTLITVAEDIGGPHVDEYLTPTEVTVGGGATFESYTFFEIFDADGGYDFTTDYVNVFSTGDENKICPDGEGLTKCRTYFNIDLDPQFTRVSATRAWQFVSVTYDARFRLMVRPYDIERGSERDIATTIDPERVVDEYVPVSAVVPTPVWAQRVPGSFPDNVPSYEDLSTCATVRTADGDQLTLDSLDNFPINMFDEHVIELQDCQPEDSGPPLNPVSVQARSLFDVPYLDPGAPYAWTMDGVVFTRGNELPITGEMPEVVGGSDGAMFVSTDDGWMLVEEAGDDWTARVVAPAGTAAPRFIADRRYAVLDGGAVYGLDEQMEVGTMAGVTDPADLIALGHGELLARETAQGLTLWSTEGGSPTEVFRQDGPRTASLLDASSNAEHLLERDGDIVRVVQTIEPREANIVDLAGDEVQSAHISADGTSIFLFTTSSGRPTMTLYTLTDPTASSWTVTPEIITTIVAPYVFRRTTGEVFYRNGDPPGSPDYRAFMIRDTDGTRTVVTEDSMTDVATDGQGNLLWFDPQEVLKRMSWDTRVVEEVALPALPEGNLDPDFYLEDGFVSAIATGDWYLYDSTGSLERVSLGSLTYPLSGGRGVFLGAPGSDVDNAVALWAGNRGTDTTLVAPYEVALFDDFADQVRAFQLLFSGRQEDGALLRAPCVPYRIDTPQADYVTTPLATWYCAR